MMTCPKCGSEKIMPEKFICSFCSIEYALWKNTMTAKCFCSYDCKDKFYRREEELKFKKKLKSLNIYHKGKINNAPRIGLSV